MTYTPDPKLLRIFVAVARHRGFAKAQQELNLALSAVSAYMSQLEAQLGFKLCDRGRSGFSLTERGELMHAEALRVLGELDGFGAFAASLKGDIVGSIKVGVIDSTATDPALPLAEAIGLFCKRFPSIHFSLYIKSPQELLQCVLDSTLDLAIGFFPTKPPGLVSQLLYHEQQWLYCSDRHPLFGERHVSEALVSELSVVRRTYWTRSDLGRHGFKHSEAAVESMEALLILILSGSHLGYLPGHFAQPWVDQRRLRVLLPSSFGYKSPFTLVTRRGRSREMPIQVMKELLLQRAGG